MKKKDDHFLCCFAFTLASNDIKCAISIKKLSSRAFSVLLSKLNSINCFLVKKNCITQYFKIVCYFFPRFILGYKLLYAKDASVKESQSINISKFISLNKTSKVDSI